MVTVSEPLDPLYVIAVKSAAATGDGHVSCYPRRLRGRRRESDPPQYHWLGSGCDIDI
jgi:hypothetical protein